MDHKKNESNLSQILTVTFSVAISTFVSYHTIKQIWIKKLPVEKHGYYQIIPLFKCPHLLNKTKHLLDKEFSNQSDQYKFNLSSTNKAIPVNLLLVFYKDEKTKVENKQEIDKINVVGHVRIENNFTGSLTICKLIVDSDYRGFGFGKSLIMASYCYVNKNVDIKKLKVKKFRIAMIQKELIEFYKYFGAKLDLVITGKFYIMNIDLNKTLTQNATKFLNLKKKTHNLELNHNCA